MRETYLAIALGEKLSLRHTAMSWPLPIVAAFDAPVQYNVATYYVLGDYTSSGEAALHSTSRTAQPAKQ